MMVFADPQRLKMKNSTPSVKKPLFFHFFIFPAKAERSKVLRVRALTFLNILPIANLHPLPSTSEQIKQHKQLPCAWCALCVRCVCVVLGCDGAGPCVRIFVLCFRGERAQHLIDLIVLPGIRTDNRQAVFVFVFVFCACVYVCVSFFFCLIFVPSSSRYDCMVGETGIYQAGVKCGMKNMSQ